MTSTQPAQAAQQQQQPEGQHFGTYIYCVTSASAAPDGQALTAQGIGGEPVRAVPYSDLAAIVSNSPFDSYDVTRENLMAHEQVVEAVMQRADVLPVSFGTVAENDQVVQQQLLAAASNDLHQALELVHGRVELGVKALWQKDRLFDELAAEDETIQALREEIAGTTPEETYDQRTQLGELIAAGIERKRQEDAAAIRNALQSLAVDARENQLLTDLMVLNASYLVEKQQIPAFEAQLNALEQAQAGRLIFQYSGPLPPYNFVSITPGAPAGTEEGEGTPDVDVEIAR